MRILEVVDSPWAIGKLAEAIKEGNPHHKIEILTIHPKEYRADNAKFNAVFEEKIRAFRPQVIHFHYWDTAQSLSQLPVTDGIKKILTHHNQKNLLTHDWKKIDVLVVHTQKAKKILQDAGYWNVEVIQHGIDIEHFQFNEQYDTDNRLLGYTGRVVPWKNLYEILKVAKDIDSEVVMMGKIDKADYWAKCQEFDEQMDIRFGTSYEDQPFVYHEMAVYIGNSSDNIEEGTLGLLEAMACGVPVITTRAGEAQDIILHGENGFLVDFDDSDNLRTMVERFFQMKPDEKNEMRQKAWDTVRHLSKQAMARNYERLYYHIAYIRDLVSVIIPTCNRSETIINVLEGYAKQSYAPLELIVIIDEVQDEGYEPYAEALSAWAKERDVPVKWEYTNNAGYGLAQARNQGIFRSVGNYLIFNDDRFIPSPVAVEIFVKKLSGKKNLVAVWGDKGGGKRSFIENFFIIRRKHIVQAGMFNERINEYGGQSQEIRERLKNQGFELIYEPLAIAVPQFGTHSRKKRRYELFRTKLKLWILNK